MHRKIVRRRKTRPWTDIPFELSLAEVMKDLVEPSPRFGGYEPGIRRGRAISGGGRA
jgi:hypothetical protein